MPDRLEPMPEHATLIALLIVDRPTCLPCIATKGDMSVVSVMSYLEQIATSVMVHEAARQPCRVCGVVGPVVFIGRASRRWSWDVSAASFRAGRRTGRGRM